MSQSGMTVNGGAQAAFDVLPGGVLAVKFSGVFTAQKLRSVKAEICNEAGRVRLVVADYRSAVLTLTDSDYSAMMAGDDVAVLPGVPAAVVAPLATAATLRRYAVEAAYRGKLRRIFLDPEQALQWAQGLARGQCFPQ